MIVAAQNSLNASGAKLTRACVPRTVNGTGQDANGNTRLVGFQCSTETYPSTPVLLKAGTPRVLYTRECISLWLNLNSVTIKFLA